MTDVTVGRYSISDESFSTICFACTRGNYLNWFTSYLSKQKVDLAINLSLHCEISFFPRALFAPKHLRTPRDADKNWARLLFSSFSQPSEKCVGALEKLEALRSGIVEENRTESCCRQRAEYKYLCEDESKKQQKKILTRVIKSNVDKKPHAYCRGSALIHFTGHLNQLKLSQVWTYDNFFLDLFTSRFATWKRLDAQTMLTMT